MCVCVCVCVCVCARARVHACVCACVRVCVNHKEFSSHLCTHCTNTGDQDQTLTGLVLGLEHS